MSDHQSTSTSWHVEQSASEAYEAYLVPTIFTAWADRLLEAAGVQNGDRVLDVACGTGIVARRAATRVGDSGSIVGLDVNEKMLAVAAETTTDGHPPIEWRQDDATDLPFSDEEFDVVSCQQALQFFDDPSTAIEEMRRVLTPGGRIALSVWRPLDFQPAYLVLADALEHHIGDEAGTMMRSPFPDWDADYLRTLASNAGVDTVSVTIEIDSMRYPSVREFVRREVASSPLAEPIAAIEQAVRDDLIQDVEHALDVYLDDEGIVSPMESYVIMLNL